MVPAPGDPPEDLAAAIARLDDVLLGGPRDLTLADVAARAGVAQERVVTYWRALGLPVPAPDVPAFTASDAAVIGSFIGAREEFALSRDAGVSLVRAMGHSIERLVAWQTETIVEHLASKYELSDDQARRLFLERMPSISALLERGLVHSWHRHVAAIATRVAAVAENAAGHGSDELPLELAVGLADIAGFTTRTAELGAAALADYVQDFESHARDVVAMSGGRVIKTVGDAVLYVADDVSTGARVALGLVHTFGPETDAPLRVGLVWGRVLSRFGDVFGPPVALAARLCDQAGPGRVLVDEVTAGALPGFLLDPIDELELAGIGPLSPSLLIAER
jgi:adenylate cyclase